MLGWTLLLLLLHGLTPIAPAELFVDAAMKTEGIERWRELLGLLLVASYHLGLARWLRPPPPAVPPAPPDPR